MKRKRIIQGLFIFLLVGISTSVWAGTKRLVLRVDGLACPFCAYGLEKKIMRMPGVLSYDADLEKGEVNVSIKDDADVDVGFLQKAVEDAGFTLRKVLVRTADGNKELKISEGAEK